MLGALPQRHDVSLVRYRHVGQPGDRRHERSRARIEVHARCDHGGVVSLHHELRSVAPRECGPFAHHGHPVGAFHPAREPGARRLNHRAVRSMAAAKSMRTLPCDAELGRTRHQMRHARALAQRLGGRAPDIHAAAAQRTALEHHHPLAMLRQRRGQRWCGLPRADDHGIDAQRVVARVHAVTWTPFQKATRPATCSAPALGVG
jgi:hypothetical protein